MKVLAIALLALVAAVNSKSINLEDLVDLEDLTAYGYYDKIGIPLANAIRESEAKQQSRIAGGSQANLGQFPFQTGLLANFGGSGTGVCGGVILTPNRVATAAHCWFDGRNQAISLTVVAGSITLFSGGQRPISSNVEMHGSWNPNLIRNDVAVIILSASYTFNVNVGSVALPSGDQLQKTFAGETATASGFGRTSDGITGGITQAQRLSHVDMPIITNAQCAQTYNIIVDSTICTSGAGGMSTCGGDSGGPLTVVDDGRLTLVGIVSFGSALGCTRGMHAGFARVTSFTPWFNERI